MPAAWPRSLKKTKMTQQARLARLRNAQYIAADKVQLILKCLFWCLQFSPQTNENNSTLHTRAVVSGGAEGALAPPEFKSSVNPIPTGGGRLCPPHYC